MTLAYYYYAFENYNDDAMSLGTFQYVATVDETPAYLGGKDNTWRRLNLDGE